MKKGFTLYELLAVILILGIITSVMIPLGSMSYRNYQANLFTQDALHFEQVTKERINYYSKYTYAVYNGPRTKRIKYPITSSFEENGGNLLDDVESEKIIEFVDDILYFSKYSELTYTYEHQKAEIRWIFDKQPAFFTIHLENNLDIVFRIFINSTSTGSYDYGYITDVTLSKDDQTYSFRV